jgi:tRNA A37 threonylcarbamoyladenosine modification protein TsaB
LLIDSSGPQLVCALADARGELRDLVAFTRGTAETAGTPTPLPVARIPQDLKSIIVGTGPGSFIGTRTAISFTNGYAAAASHAVDLRGVNTLAAISAEHGGLPVLRDARRGQWYLWTPKACAAHDEATVLALLQEQGARSVVLEWPEGEPELAVQLRTTGITVQLVKGVTAAGLQLAASQAEPEEYVEPIYLRGFT